LFAALASPELVALEVEFSLAAAVDVDVEGRDEPVVLADEETEEGIEAGANADSRQRVSWAANSKQRNSVESMA